MTRIVRFGMVGLTVVMLLLIGTQLMSVSPTLAATIDKIIVTCSIVGVRGKTEVNAPYVRVQVVLASNLTIVIAQQVVSTRPRAGADYSALLDIWKAHLAEGTLLVITAGEWDDTKYLRPATITGVECNRDGGTQPPTPVPSPTFGPSPTFVATLLPTFTPVASPSLPPVSPTPPPTPRPH